MSGPRWSSSDMRPPWLRHAGETRRFRERGRLLLNVDQLFGGEGRAMKGSHVDEKDALKGELIEKLASSFPA